MNKTTNTTTNNIKSRVFMIALGRGKQTDPTGHYAYCAWDELSNEKAHGGQDDFVPAEMPLYAQLLNVIATELELHVNEGMKDSSIEVYSILNGVVLKFREVMKQYNQNKANGIADLDIEAFYQNFMDEKQKSVVARFATALKTLWDNGNIVRVSDSNLINYVELMVPQGVKIPDGTVLKFANSKATFKASNGYSYEITARWKNFKRERATVRVFDAEGEYPVYAVKLSNQPSGRTLQLLMAKSNLYKLCPEHTVDRVAEMLEDVA